MSCFRKAGYMHSEKAPFSKDMVIIIYAEPVFIYFGQVHRITHGEHIFISRSLIFCAGHVHLYLYTSILYFIRRERSFISQTRIFTVFLHHASIFPVAQERYTPDTYLYRSSTRIDYLRQARNFKNYVGLNCLYIGHVKHIF